jgi:hypothetical protein
MKFLTQSGLLVTAAASLALLSSCANNGGRSPSGFLSHYGQMDGGYGTADAVSVFVKPGAELEKYDSVIIDPVTTIVASPGIGADVKDQLASYLSGALRQEMSGSLKIVSAPGPTTLRVRTALTDVIEGESAGVPQTIVHTANRAPLSGKIGSETVAAFVAKMSFEGEIVDSVTGERQFALIDHRLGAKRETTAATPWSSIRAGMVQGVRKLSGRFDQLRSR